MLFPSDAELKAYFSNPSLPKGALRQVRVARYQYSRPQTLELGGELPSLTSSQRSPLHQYIVCPSEPSSSASTSSLRSTSAALIPHQHDTHLQRGRTAQPVAFPAMSPLNPFFGYPVEPGSGSLSAAPTLRHGRRRKRDLFRTLVRLWWSRWGHRVKTALFVLVFVLSFVLGRRRLRVRNITQR